MIVKHKCPRCGKETDGSWSEGGLKWAICEECMEQDRKNTDSESEGEK